MDVRYVANPTDVSVNTTPPQKADKSGKSDADKINKFDSMFGLNTYAQSVSPDTDDDTRNRRDEFTSETSLIR